MRETAINVENIDLFMSGNIKTTSRASNSLFLVFESRTGSCLVNRSYDILPVIHFYHQLSSSHYYWAGGRHVMTGKEIVTCTAHLFQPLSISSVRLCGCNRSGQVDERSDERNISRIYFFRELIF